MVYTDNADDLLAGAQAQVVCLVNGKGRVEIALVVSRLRRDFDWRLL